MKRVTRMNAGYVRVDTDTLAKLREDIQKNGKARVHVGILGVSAERVSGDTLNNPSLGAVHEFGSIERNIPSRSFLRMPVIQELPAALQATTKDQWHKVIVKKGLLGALGLLGSYALDVIQLAFDTSGFGSWSPLKPRTIRRKGSSAILIDTAQMRQSITAEVVMPKSK